MHSPGRTPDDEPVTLEELGALVAGELSPAAEEALRTRIERDPGAQARLERLALVDTYFPGLPRDRDLPEGVRARLAERARQEADRFHAGLGPPAGTTPVDERGNDVGENPDAGSDSGAAEPGGR